MNKKQSAIDTILKIVVECCDIDIDGESQVTEELVRGKSRRESVCMTRCIFVTEMMLIGFSRSTISAYLHRDIKSIGNILAQAHEYRKTSRAYAIAEAEATIRLKDFDFKELFGNK